MRAIYQEKPNCGPCLDIYGSDAASECKHCMELHRYDVEILQLGIGLFANKAVIQKADGKLETVPLNSLTMIGSYKKGENYEDHCRGTG